MVWSLLLSGTFYDSHGQDQLFFPEFDSPATNNGIAVNADDDEFHQLFANRLLGRLHIARTCLAPADKGIPTASFGTVFNVTGTRTIDARGYLDLQYDRKLGRGWSLTNRATSISSITMALIFTIIRPRADPSRVLNKNFAHGKWWGDEVTFSKQLFARQRLSVGARISATTFSKIREIMTCNPSFNISRQQDLKYIFRLRSG